MFLPTPAALLLWAPLLSAVLGQTPPNFSPSAQDHLTINFNSTFIEPPGTQIGINVPLDPPTLSLSHLPSSYIKTYLFALIDPDAPSPAYPIEAQFLHFLLPDIPAPTTTTYTKNKNKNKKENLFILDTTTPTPFVPYVNPTPPNNSTAHRYIGLLFAQPENFAIPQAFQDFSAANRSLFNITVFAEEADLGSPVFANWFLVSNQTVFPGGGE